MAKRRADGSDLETTAKAARQAEQGEQAEKPKRSKQGKQSKQSKQSKQARKAGQTSEQKAARPPERYPLPDLATLPEDLRERILAVQEKSGFVPNVFLKLARRPAEFRAFFAYYDALMLGAGPLTKAEREMIVVATSALNNCLYCVVAHGAILRIYQKDPLIADQLATNYRKAPLPPRQRAMLDFACKVASSSASIDDSDHRLLQAQGLDAEAIWDIAAIAAFFALSNRIANFSGMMPNEEFYAMGRGDPAQAARPAR